MYSLLLNLAMVIKVMLSILFLGIIVPTAIGQPHVEYLRGVQRLTNSSYTDYYFSCDLTGDFLQWLYNDVPLRGFRIHDAGRVVVIARPTYNYTATLLSSQLDPESNQRRLDSVLVLSFNDNHPTSSFEVTCSSNSDFNTTRVTGLHGNAISNSSTNGEVVLDHIISTEIVQNKNRTHIFICGAQNDLQFYNILSSRPIGFNEHDNVGRARTDLSQDGNLVNVQGVLIAQLPNQKTSLLFITENPDVTVTCFFGTTQALLKSSQVAPRESNPLSPPLHTAPVTTTTTNSSASHATTLQSSTTYGTDGTGFAGSSSIVAAAVVVLCVLLCGAVSIIVVVFIIKISRKRKIMEVIICECSKENEKIHVVASCITFQSQREEYLPNPPTYFKADEEYSTPEIGPSKSIRGETADLESSPPSKDVLMETSEDNTSDSAYGSNSPSDETGSNSPPDETPDKEDASMALDMDIESPLKREDTPMVADLEAIAVGGGKLEHESASSSRHTSEVIQYSVEESSTEDASDRVSESSILDFGHEHGGIEPVKSFGSLQEAVFIVADGLGQSYWNASVSESPDVVLCDESSDVATTATGINFKMLIQNMDNNVDVTNVYTTCGTNNHVHATEEDEEPHDDVCITEDDKDPQDDVRIMEEDSCDVCLMDEDRNAEDRDALDAVRIMEEDKDALEVPSTEEDEDTLDDIYITGEDKDVLDDVPGTREDKDACGNAEEDKHAKSDKRAIAEKNGADSEQDYDYHVLLNIEERLCKFVEDIPRTDYTSSLCTIFRDYHKDFLQKLQKWCEFGLGGGTMITSLAHGNDGFVDKEEDVYWPLDEEDVYWPYWPLDEEEYVYWPLDEEEDVYWPYYSILISEDHVYVKEKEKKNFSVSIKGDPGDTEAVNILQEWMYWKKKKNFSAISMKGDPGDAVNSLQVNYFNQWFSLIDITEARKITEIVEVIQLAFRMIQALMLYFQDVLWLQPCKSEISGVPLDGGGTLHVPVVGTSSWWGRVRLDLLKCMF